MSQVLNLVIDARLKAVAALALLEGGDVDDLDDIKKEAQGLVSKSAELYSYVTGRAILDPLPGQTVIPSCDCEGNKFSDFSLDDALGQGRR